MVKNWDKKELSYLQDTDFLLTKQEITKKITSELNEVSAALTETLLPFQSRLKTEYLKVNKKISKGENYLGLPYFVLDFPGYFKKSEVFAYRIMIWWGKEISFTLHLGGTVKSMFEKRIQLNKSAIDPYFVCINELPWEYHFNETNYQLIKKQNDLDFSETIANKEFVKISTRLNIKEIGKLKEHATRHLSHYLHVLFEFDQK